MRISFDPAAEIYDKTRGPPRQVMKKLVKTLISELSCYETILDVGVGTGRFTKPLQDSGFEVVGVDIAKKMINKAVEKGCTQHASRRRLLPSFQRQLFRCYGLCTSASSS